MSPMIVDQFGPEEQFGSDEDDAITPDQRLRNADGATDGHAAPDDRDPLQRAALILPIAAIIGLAVGVILGGLDRIF